MPKVKDLTGMKFGRLTVIKRHGYMYKNKIAWLCKCDCGNEKVVIGDSLKRGLVRSCGCLHSEKWNKIITTHGLSEHPLYNIWCAMKRRCNNPKTERYPHYGGRGIKVCAEWENDFKAFYDWSVSHGYKKELSIDRIDANGNYCPENCRWADNYTQSINRTDNRRFLYRGKEYTVSELSNMFNINYHKLYRKLVRGTNIDEIIKEMSQCSNP